jgi:hypothetical protein
VSEAQQIFLQRARCNGAARDGRWSPSPEQALVA